jgi:hypothetical protein
VNSAGDGSFAALAGAIAALLLLGGCAAPEGEPAANPAAGSVVETPPVDPTLGWYRCDDESRIVRGFDRLRQVELSELSGMTPFVRGDAAGLLLASDDRDDALFFLDRESERPLPLEVSAPGVGAEPEGVAAGAAGTLLVATEPHCGRDCSEPGRLVELLPLGDGFAPNLRLLPLEEPSSAVCGDGNCWYEGVATFHDGWTVLGKERDPTMLLFLDPERRLRGTLEGAALLATLGLTPAGNELRDPARLLRLAARLQAHIAGLAAWREGDREYLAVANRLQRRVHVLRRGAGSPPTLTHELSCCYRLTERSWFGEVEAIAVERDGDGLMLHLGQDTGHTPSPLYSTRLGSIAELCR